MTDFQAAKAIPRSYYRMTDTERQYWRQHAILLNQQIYVFRSRDEAGEPIWVYDTLPPMGRRCEIFGPWPKLRDAA